MITVNSIKAAHDVVKAGSDCIAVIQLASEEPHPIIGGWVRSFRFYNYTMKQGKNGPRAGWVSCNTAYQIHV